MFIILLERLQAVISSVTVYYCVLRKSHKSGSPLNWGFLLKQE